MLINAAFGGKNCSAPPPLQIAPPCASVQQKDLLLITAKPQSMLLEWEGGKDIFFYFKFK